MHFFLHITQQMGKKPLLQLLILLLGFSYVLSSEASKILDSSSLEFFLVAVPGSLVNVNYDPASVEIVEQVMNNRKVLMVVEKESMREDMEIDKNDYPGSGANDRHEPKSPPGRG